jgi:hypothetical protein
MVSDYGWTKTNMIYRYHLPITLQICEPNGCLSRVTNLRDTSLAPPETHISVLKPCIISLDRQPCCAIIPSYWHWDTSVSGKNRRQVTLSPVIGTSQTVHGPCRGWQEPRIRHNYDVFGLRSN